MKDERYRASGIRAFNCFCRIERDRFEMARKSRFSTTSLEFHSGLGIPFFMAANGKRRMVDAVEEQERSRKGGGTTLMTIEGSTGAVTFAAALISPD